MAEAYRSFLARFGGLRKVPPRLALSGVAGLLLVAFFIMKEVPTSEERVLAAYPGGLGGAPEIRVALARGPEGVRVSVTGRFELLGERGDAIPIRNANLAAVRVRASGGGLAVGDSRLASQRSIQFVPAEGSEVWLDGVALPGSLRVTREGEGGAVAAVAAMNVEAYVCAGLAATADWRAWSDESLAAHAVAIRTNALFRRSVAGEGEAYDFDEPALLGVMRTSAHLSARVARAVNRTRGIVMSWDRKLFPAYVTQACGGRTSDASRVFTASSITPLSGAECLPCLREEHPMTAWTRRMSLRAVGERLRPFVESGGTYRLGAVKRVSVLAAGEGGRVERFRIDASFGEFEMDAEAFRRAIGTDDLSSALVEIVELGPETMEFRGRGEGHGVGLCQHGAERMGSAGVAYRDILGRYFPGAELTRLPYATRRLREGGLIR